jgi:hypothetical protein
MKKSLFYTGIILLSSIAFAFGPASETECNTKDLKKEGISMLDPFYYSSSKVNIIKYDYRAQRKEIVVPLFKGEEYNMIFNKKALPKDVIIEIYDKDKSHEGRSPLFTSKGTDSPIVSYVPKKSKKMFVNYIVPSSKGSDESGCLVFVLGYKLTFIKSEKAESAE